MTFNPVLNIRMPSPCEGRNRRLMADEEKRLLAAVNKHSNPMLGWIVQIALATGMRASEIASLNRSQIDIQKRIVRLSDTKNDSARTVPLSKLATEVFRTALANPVRPIDCDLVFFGEPGKDQKRRPYAFTKVWGTIKKKANVPDFRFHDLRHEAVSLSREDFLIRRFPRSAVINRCRCSSAIRIYVPRIWCVSSISLAEFPNLKKKVAAVWLLPSIVFLLLYFVLLSCVFSCYQFVFQDSLTTVGDNFPATHFPYCHQS